MLEELEKRPLLWLEDFSSALDKADSVIVLELPSFEMISF